MVRFLEIGPGRFKHKGFDTVDVAGTGATYEARWAAQCCALKQ